MRNRAAQSWLGDRGPHIQEAAEDRPCHLYLLFQARTAPMLVVVPRCCLLPGMQFK